MQTRLFLEGSTILMLNKYILVIYIHLEVSRSVRILARETFFYAMGTDLLKSHVFLQMLVRFVWDYIPDKLTTWSFNRQT